MKKRCTRCNQLRDLLSFQKRKASKDGLTSACKECLSEYDKKRANLPHRVKARKKYAETEKGKIAVAKAKKSWQERNIIKRAAHIIVNNAIRDGKLKKQSCEKCGNKKVHAHHDDYTKPLKVRWLCPKCHIEWHKQNGEF